MRLIQQHVQELQEKGVVSPLAFDQTAAVLARLDPNIGQTILAQWSQTMPLVTSLITEMMVRHQQGANNPLTAVGSAAPSMGMDPNAGQPTEQGGAQTVEQPEAAPDQRAPRREGGGEI
jgi:hypothetical protein